MQQINLSAPRAPLVVVMLGTTGLAVATAVLARSPLVVAGCAAFLASIAAALGGALLLMVSLVG
jgi:hypothetical protein